MRWWPPAAGRWSEDGARGAGAGAAIVVDAGVLATATAVVFGGVVWLLVPQPTAANATDAHTQTRPRCFVWVLIGTDSDNREWVIPSPLHTSASSRLNCRSAAG